MNSKKGLFLVLLSMMLVLAACGGGGGSSNGNETNGSATNGSGESSGQKNNETEKPAKKVKLKIGLPGSYDVTSKEIMDKFIETHPHIDVTIQEAPWGDFTSKIAAQIAGNTMPDVWFQENAAVLGYGKRGVAEDLTPYLARDIDAAQYIDGLFSARSPEGNVWGVPHGINPVALAFNKAAFEKANVDLPTDEWTFNDLIESAKKLTIGTGKNVEQYGFIGSYAITNGWYPWMKQAGGSALDETMKKSNFDSPETLAGLKQLDQGIKEGYFTNNDFVKANGGDMEVFAGGKAAMFFMQYSLQVNMNESFADVDWDVVKMPKAVDGKRYVPMVANTWLISSRAKDEAKEAAWEFLKFYLGDEAQQIVAESGSTLPVKQSAYDVIEQSTTKPANKKAFTDGIAEGGTTLDENASWSEWRLIVQQQVNEAIVHGNISVEEALADIHPKVQEVLDQNE
ncbi:ABC transporter substrate-binding protein [Paenibacillus yanchengensis]|uniref:ABC transporter substrate-binding protein n=1 Tax=Paenibacillus yanchengensis TaxID=2035833 RepID=A0ABW4YJF5_9BACL